MQNSSTLLYEPLERVRKAIRLLTVFAGREEEALQSHLTHAVLDDPAVVYETISYSWGDATARDPITVDGNVVDVPASAVAALRCMRRAEGPRVIWIDSICINQTDLDERAYQVGMMADIYRSAKGNLVYLGESDERTRDAFEMAERLYQEIRRKTSDFSEFHSLMRRHLHGGGYADDELECRLDERALTSVFGRPWFQRLWIIQEATLAVVNTCFCGRSFSINLSVLLRVAIWLCYHKTSLSPWFYDQDALHNAADMWSLVDDKDSASAAEYSYERNLTSLLLMAQYRQCSEPRDKVFAILSMVDKEAESSPEMSLLGIEYRKPCHEVMRDATRYAIQELNSLGILRETRHRVTDQDLELDGYPSWVARIDRPFDEAHDAEPLGDLMFRANAEQCLYGEDLRSDFVGRDVLCVSGYAVSRIIEVSDVFEPSIWENRARVAEILGSLMVMVGKLDKKESGWWSEFKLGGVDIPYNMVETIILGQNRYGQNASVNDVIEFAALLEKLISHPSAPLQGDEDELYETLRSSCSHRRFYTGSDEYLGYYIGMGPRCVRAGDETAILLGSSVPFALRPFKTNDERHEGRSFQLLGDVWAFGLMEGFYAEASREAGNLPLQFFLV
ncbi:HET-domain-containing protein [Ustulina deusta]|nr:HET-domain-containing protein [Ustulina deusta]